MRCYYKYTQKVRKVYSFGRQSQPVVNHGGQVKVRNREFEAVSFGVRAQP